MSYSILYESVFLKSTQGYTPCVLMGDNNVYEGSGKNERRSRSWSVLFNRIGASPDELEAEYEQCLGGYGEHWKHGGKWCDDKGLINFFKNGIAKAITVEELMALNAPRRIGHPCAMLSVWGKGEGWDHKTELSAYIHSTEELDAWIAQAKDAMAQYRSEGKSVYPIIDFGTEKLTKTAGVNFAADEMVVVKKGSYYLESFGDKTSRWSVDPADALKMRYEEAMAFLSMGLCDGSPRIIRAKTVEQPRDWTLYFSDGMFAGNYISSISARRFRYSTDARNAHRYSSENAAETARKKLGPRVEKYGTLVVRTLDQAS